MFFWAGALTLSRSQPGSARSPPRIASRASDGAPDVAWGSLQGRG